MLLGYWLLYAGQFVCEASAAIGAGLVLGALAFRTDSIWGGAALHIVVAITMDALAMSAPGGVGWPS